MGKQVLLVSGLAAWAGCIALGFLVLGRHAGAPGQGASPPERWPAECAVPRVPAQPTLLLFVHPHCPCSRASLNELERVLASAEHPVGAWILVVQLEGKAEDREKSTNEALARAIPRAQTAIDRGGKEARRFGVRTSGQLVYYDPGGRLRFHGGITAARGHEGRSVGGDSVLALLNLEATAAAATCVFGCPLFGPECPEGGE